MNLMTGIRLMCLAAGLNFALQGIAAVGTGLPAAETPFVTNVDFTVDLLLNLDNACTNETLYRFGALEVALRKAGKLEYDWNYGNYMNFRMPNGKAPVLEATICEKGGRVGVPLSAFARTGGHHRMTVNLSGIHFSMAVDGHVDDDMPPEVAYRIAWPENAKEERLSPRVVESSFCRPSRPNAIPLVQERRPLADSPQYWTPKDHNAWVGDVALRAWNGRLHLFYLFDRRHHHSGVTAGRHYFAHLSTDDLVHWFEHPHAVPIERGYECIGTGTPFVLDGELCLAYGLHTDRVTKDPAAPIGGTFARSPDGVHFTKSDRIVTGDQNPSIFNLPNGDLAIATAGGRLFRQPAGGLASDRWVPWGEPAPAGGDCPAFFSWGDRDYLLQGFYWMASRKKGHGWEDWATSGEDVYGGLSVPMVAEWKDGRRILAGWLQHTQGWGGWLVLRELIRFDDGRLGDKWPEELLPRGEIVTYEDVDPSRPFVLRCSSADDNTDVEFRVDPKERRAQFAFPRKGENAGRPQTASEIIASRPAAERFERRNQKGAFPWWCGEAAIGKLRGLDRPYRVRIAAYYDAKSDATIFDAEIAGCRTFITRRRGRYGRLSDCRTCEIVSDEALSYLTAVSAENVKAGRFKMLDGTAAYPPQAKGGYEAFFLRDYAYVLEGCASVIPPDEQLAAARLFVRGIDKTGAGVDCVFSDGTFNYKPGGGRIGEHPVADGTVFTIDVVYLSWRETKSPEFLEQALLDRLLFAWKNGVPRNLESGLVTIKPRSGTIDVDSRLDRAPYGFTDIVRKQGDVLFTSLLDHEASLRLAEMLDAAGRKGEADVCREHASRVKVSVNRVFWDEGLGLYDAATVTCRQGDVWGSAFAVWLGVSDGSRTRRIAETFRRNYKGLVQGGQIRHLLPGEYWELAEARKDTYQNGGYWGTPSGWFVYALAKVDPELAAQTVRDLVTYYRTKGIPEWCFSGVGHGYNHLDGYLSSSTLPLAVFRKMRGEGRKVRDFDLPH